jgi:cell division septal protein FtsQ
MNEVKQYANALKPSKKKIKTTIVTPSKSLPDIALLLKDGRVVRIYINIEIQ